MSKIEWTDETWNPTVGCNEVSPGCQNCYAARTAWRLSKNPVIKQAYEGTVMQLPNGKITWTGRINMLEERLLDPARRQRPTRYFVDSMSDLFHPDVPFEFIAKVYAVMALCPQHTFQVLTKRPDRALEFYGWLMDGDIPASCRFDDIAEELVSVTPDLFHVKDWYVFEGKKDSYLTNELLEPLKTAGWFWDITITEFGEGDVATDSELVYDGPWPLPNVWIGTSVENQKCADERIPYLIQIPAAVHFLSCEPLLAEVNIEKCPIPRVERKRKDGTISLTHIGYIDWVIVGGESGPGARPMHPDWARMLRDECQAAGVAFFFKQWGEYIPFEPTAQPPFYKDSATGEEHDGHRMNFVNAETGDPGKFGGCPWMDGTEAMVRCAENGARECMFLKVGKKKAERFRKLDGVAHAEFPEPIEKKV